MTRSDVERVLANARAARKKVADTRGDARAVAKRAYSAARQAMCVVLRDNGVYGVALRIWLARFDDEEL
jgi:hypothetical protein